MDMTILKPDWVIALFTVVLVIVTAVYAFLTFRILHETRRQANIQAANLGVQNQLLHAQLLSQRLEMYWKTFAPITDAELAQMALLPEDWMNPTLFEQKYKNDTDSLRRYMSLAKIYEYLALMSAMKKLEIPDPVGYDWTTQWTRDLAQRTEFMEINDHYRPYYPEFSTLVDSLHGKPALAES